MFGQLPGQHFGQKPIHISFKPLTSSLVHVKCKLQESIWVWRAGGDRREHTLSVYPGWILDLRSSFFLNSLNFVPGVCGVGGIGKKRASVRGIAWAV